MFYTYSRFQPIVRRFHHHHQGDFVDVSKSHSIFTVLPWRVSYRAVLLDPSAELMALNREDRENAVEMRKIDLTAEKLHLQNKQQNFQRILVGQGGPPHVLESLQMDIQEHERQIEPYHTFQDSIERRARRAEAVRAAGNSVHMKDFKIDHVEQAHGAKARASTGLKGTGNVFLNAEQAAGRTYVSEDFQWTEENFFGHGHAWEGRIDIGCRQDGSPEVLDGDGKFFDRYFETRRGWRRPPAAVLTPPTAGRHPRFRCMACGLGRVGRPVRRPRPAMSRRARSPRAGTRRAVRGCGRWARWLVGPVGGVEPWLVLRSGAGGGRVRR
ncbi:hypothetical protein ACFV6B_26610 [Streptomyces microflavus]|uniref:hypothetical protein n=1 Tax=Streptomyces microflavus TaxID=1919 RepID=UPI003667B951